ncbi:MAG: DNA-protecting protein DprA [Lachnospiraceae bacterium]|nr:DNA-protecting protein DprA [Lachnospiraceae bacterium]
MANDYYMMWLTGIKGMTVKKAYLLLSYFGKPEEIWNSDKMLLCSINGISENFAERIIESRDPDVLDEKINRLEELGIKYISINNPDYPELLRHIDEPPLGLYYKGTLPKKDDMCFSIIGSRLCSEYGSLVSQRFAKELVQNGFTIVSGMARGIDSMSHRGAINGGGKTIAVLGCGLDICYPPENQKLMAKIEENGCLISEYPPGTQPYPGNFPPRNRIIAGLSMGLLVVEASKRSGTLITVNHALDYGRDVFAVPANITSDLSAGTNELIKDGCPPVTCVEDILFELGVIKNVKEEKIEQAAAEELTEEEQEILSCIKYEPVSLDDLIILLDKPSQSIQYILTYLEIYGYIKRLPGQRFVRAY